MPDLPARPDLDQLRHQAKDVLHAAQRGDPDAIKRLNAVSDQITLSTAQLALARGYGFASWRKLKLEVDRRDILNSRDLSRLTRLLAEHVGGERERTATAAAHQATGFTAHSSAAVQRCVPASG